MKNPDSGREISPTNDLAGYEVIVAVTGGIAAYKVCEVVSRLVQRGAGVTVAMTRAARRFVRPLTFQALSGRSVLTNLWDMSARTKVRDSLDGIERIADAPKAEASGGSVNGVARTVPARQDRGSVEDDSADIQHIHLTTRADLVVVAPATANVIGKMAGGLADDVVTNLVISADSSVLIAPAMNDRMWCNAAVQRNMATLRQDGIQIVGPAEGWLACRSVGQGRMVEAADLVEAIAVQLKKRPAKCSA